jgi:hypothetical protein
MGTIVCPETMEKVATILFVVIQKNAVLSYVSEES